MKAESIAEKRKEAEKQEQQLDQLYFNLFDGHKEGQDILRDLMHRFYDRSSVVGSPVDVAGTMVREGERNVVLYIMARISSFQERKA